ncbi:MAG: C39 family peptidase [Blastocatellia bacterium]|nr:C39 family peptidase [Blastocatellia bacterium]
MFFESRFELPRISSRWTLAFESFRYGRTFEAYDAGRNLAADNGFSSADEVLLWADILRSVGRETQSLDLFRQTTPVTATDLRAEVQVARTLSARGRVLAALRHLDGLKEQSGGSDLYRTLIEAERASEFAGLHMAESAAAAGEAARSSPAASHPWVMYSLAFASFRLRHWQSALDLFTAISVDCPHWPRPWVLAHRCLASLGRSDDASKIISAASKRFPQDWRVFLTLVEDHVARNRWSQLGDVLEERLDDWSPFVEDLTPLKALLVRARWRSYDASAAVDVAKSFDADLAARLDKLRAAGYFRRFRLPVPSLVQDRYLCVATSVAMVLRLYGEGRDADPARLNAEMGAEEGVSSWQLDRWCATRGLRAIDIRCDLDAIRGALDEGFPLLACRQGVLMNHMEVIVGYDDALEEIEVTDPDEGLPHFIPYDLIAALYTKAADALVALLPDDDASVMQKVDRAWVDPNATIVRRARRLLHDGAVAEARASLGDLPPGSRHRRFLTLEAGESFAPSASLRETVHALATDVDVDPTTRFNMALSLFSMGAEDDAERVLREFDTPIPGALQRYRRALSSFWRGDLRRAGKRFEALIERMPHAEDVWHTFSTVLRASGRNDDADRALSACLEMSPVHLGANLEKMRIDRRHRPLEQLAVDARALVARHPRAVGARSMLASLELALGNAKAAEQTWQEYLALAPYSEAARGELTQWYLRQNRPDLAAGVVAPDDTTGRESDVAEPAGEFRSLIRRAWDEYGAGERGSATDALGARRKAQSLALDEDVEVRQLELNFLLLEANESGAMADLAAILPARFPFPLRRSLEHFIGRIDHRWTPPPVAEHLARWADAHASPAELSPEGRLARTYLDEIAGLAVAARATYLEIAERDRIDEAYHRAAVIAFRRGDFNDAIRDVRACVELTPGFEDAWGLMCDLGRAADSPRHLLEGLTRRIDITPYDEDIAGQYLEVLVQMHGIDEGREWLDASSHRYTPDFVRWWQLEFLGMSSNWSQVLANIDDGYRTANPRAALTFEFRALDQLGRTEAAAASLDRARELFPDDPLFDDLYACSLVNRDPDAARRIYERMLAVRPGLAAARIVEHTPQIELAGIVLQALASPDLTDAARRNAVRGFGDALADPKHARAQLEVFERLAIIDPTSAYVHGVLSALYEDAGRWTDAVRAARACVELEPHNTVSALRLGYVLTETNPEEAIGVLRTAHSKTGDGRALTPIAKSLHCLGRAREAADAYRAVLEADPSDGAAVVAVVDLGGFTPKAFESVTAALRFDDPSTAPRFSVVAVETAIAIGKPLLWAWERAALNRFAEIAENPVDAVERETLASMLFVWGNSLNRQHVVKAAAPSIARRIKLEALSRFKSWGKNTSWLPTRAALERRAAIASARFKAARDARAIESQ